MNRLLCLRLSAVVLAMALPAHAAARHADVLIRHATVVDAGKGLTHPGQSVVIQGQDIVAVGADSQLAGQWQATVEIDAGNRYLIPGLWDMHVHFGGGPALIEENKALLPLYVAHGITTVRDASGDLAGQVLQWRGQIADGQLFGPQLFTSGAKIEGLNPVWKGTIEAGDRAGVDAALDREQRDRVDFVKITDSTLTPELFLYALSEAGRRGLRTSGHIPMALTVSQAVEAGISSIEHLDYAFKAGVKDEASIAADFAAGRITRAQATTRLHAGFDRDTALAAYRRFAAQGVAVTPTLDGGRIIDFLDSEPHDKDAYLAYIGPGLRKTYQWRVQRAAQATPAQVQERHARYAEVAAVLPLLQQAGVPIMAGTDAGFLNSYNYPGIGLHNELSLYVREGLTPAQALVSATVTGPRWLGKQARYGAVASGKAADLVLLDANPLQDINATRAIHTVILRGQVLDRQVLDGLLQTARDQVSAWNAAEPAPVEGN